MSGVYALRVAPIGEVETPLWRALAVAEAPASIIDLHRACRARPNAIQHRLSRWVRAGFVTRIEGTPKRFAMTDTAPRTSEPPQVAIDGKAKPRVRSARSRLWSAIRVLRVFDLPTLIITSQATRRSAEDYINCLCRSGHLTRVRRGNAHKGEWSNYRLVQNSGPKAPSVSHGLQDGQRVRLVVDRNTGRSTDISPGRVSLQRPDTQASRSSNPVADGGVS